jgi:putative FmdB family regulatory protein
VPIYEYRCPKGHLFESFHRMSDPDPEVCEVCGASPLVKVLHPVPIHFKGSGFYSTDYGRGARKRDADGGVDGGDGGGKKDGSEKSTEKVEKKSEKSEKSEKKAATDGGS